MKLGYNGSVPNPRPLFAFKTKTLFVLPLLTILSLVQSSQWTDLDLGSWQKWQLGSGLLRSLMCSTPSRRVGRMTVLTCKAGWITVYCADPLLRSLWLAIQQRLPEQVKPELLWKGSPLRVEFVVQSWPRGRAEQEDVRRRLSWRGRVGRSRFWQAADIISGQKLATWNVWKLGTIGFFFVVVVVVVEDAFWGWHEPVDCAMVAPPKSRRWNWPRAILTHTGSTVTDCHFPERRRPKQRRIDEFRITIY